MKILTKHSFDANNCRKEWNEFVQLLAQNQTLSERNHILPFFKQSRDLSIFIGEFFFGKRRLSEFLVHHRHTNFCDENHHLRQARKRWR
jgi:hypothetical protein